MISNNDIKNAEIMIVDDNQSNVNLLKNMLLGAGYTSIFGITDPRKAIELYKTYRPDLILLDIRMPHLDGYQVMERLKKIENNGYVPILVLTALHDQETRIRSLESGAKDFLTKPFNITDTLTRICNMLEVRLLYKQILNQNFALEQKVQERTSELLKARNAMQSEKEFTENLIDTAKDSIVSIDQNGKVIVWNLSAEKTFGYSKHEMIGQPITTIIPERYKDKDQEGIERYLKTGNNIITGKTIEVDGLTKEGIEIPIEMSIAYQKLETGLYTFTAIIRDVTEKQKWADGLKRAKIAAEEANKAKSEFLATMSHEIRTPMNGVMGMTEILLETELSPEQNECAEIIRNSSNSLLSIINNILDFSKIEAGKLEIEDIDFDLSTTFDDIIDIFALKTEEKGIRFLPSLDPAVPQLLHGDPGRLRQVLINLINNAIKFTEDGEIAVNVTLKEETDTNATIHFSVKDTGIGIPVNRMHRLFKSFSQVDASTTRKYGGTGLGLAISKQITELMKGQICVESQEGKGSTFWFTILLEKQNVDKQRVPFEPGDIENMKIIVVSDNNATCHIIREYLESWQCRVEEAISTEEAMLKLQTAVNENDPFKVVLLDFCIPGEYEETFGRLIKADNRLRDTALIMLTSIGKRGDAKQFSKLGFAAYLLKPIKQSQLRNCLQIVTGKSVTTEEETDWQIVTKYSIDEERKKRINVLVVEDNTINQKVALRVLENKLGYRTDIANNGNEAIVFLEKFDYDLVLMDCNMPEMDGFEATRIIRDNKSSVRDHKIPIIAMTANTMRGDREKCLEAGMDDFVAKPIKTHILSDAIEQQLKIEGCNT